jgi:hypothetical protein
LPVHFITGQKVSVTLQTVGWEPSDVGRCGEEKRKNLVLLEVELQASSPRLYRLSYSIDQDFRVIDFLIYMDTQWNQHK